MGIGPVCPECGNPEWKLQYDKCEFTGEESQVAICTGCGYPREVGK